VILGSILVRRVGATHDERQTIQGGVYPLQSILVHQRVEAAQGTLCPSVHTRNIIGERPLRGRFGHNLIGWYIEELRPADR